MGKANKYAKQAAALAKQGNLATGNKKPTSSIPKRMPVNYIALRVGNHQFRILDDDLVGARMSDYPTYESIPDDFKSNSNVWNRRASRCFHIGSSLDALGIDYKTPEGVNARDYWVSVKIAIQMLLQSFEPSHELKIATVAWCMSEWFEEL